MTRPSPPELRILHAIRLLGFAAVTEIAARADSSPDETSTVLRQARAHGWAQEFSFADLRGWSLTDEGREENERRLARERESAGATTHIASVYQEFLPLNARLLRACTDWQLTPVAHDRFAPNDHTDSARDERTLGELAVLSDALAPLIGRLTAVLARFAGYDERFASALRRAQSGQHDWVDKTNVDSCHRVWFQLHEDLLATLGIDRGAG